MPKSENRATRRLREATGTAPHSEHRKEPPHSTPTWFQRQRKASVELISAISAILAISYSVLDALQEPQIHAQTAQSSTPFSLYFSWYNPSLIFNMNQVQIECRIDDVITASNTRLMGFNVATEGAMISIPSRKTGQYICPFDKAVEPPQTIVNARIMLQVRFKTLFFQRSTFSENFNWNNDSKQWVQGEIIR